MRRAASFRADERGATAMEFALVAPLLFFTLVSLFEIGVVAMMSSSIDGAVYEASRRIRTGREDAATSAATFEDQVCAIIGGDLAACRNRLVVSVQRYANFSGANAAADSPPDNSFNKGGAGDIIIVKANYRWPMMVPLIGELIGGARMNEVNISARAAFKNEPFT